MCCEDIMWDDELLQRARLEQAVINSAARAPKARDAVTREKDAIMAMVVTLTKRKMIHKVVEDLQKISTQLKEFINDTLEVFHIRTRDDAFVTSCIEELRGSMYQMTQTLTDRGLRVNVLNQNHARHIQSIRTCLKEISRTLNDDCIELDVDMDTSKDHEMAMRLQGLLD